MLIGARPESARLNVGSFYALRTEVTGAPLPTELAHPIYAEFAKESAEEPSIDLLKEPEVQAFRIPVKELEPYLEEVNRAQESVLVVSRTSQEDRIMGAVEKAIGELLSGERARAPAPSPRGYRPVSREDRDAVSRPDGRRRGGQNSRWRRPQEGRRSSARWCRRSWAR